MKHFRLLHIVNAAVLIAFCGVLCCAAYDYYAPRAYTPTEIAPLQSIEHTARAREPPILQDKPAPQTPYSKNKVGWLTVSGLEVDEPVLQGSDNSFYLTHDAFDAYNAYGACFAMADCSLASVDTLNRVTVLFGHSAGNSEKDGFARLKKLRDADIAAESRVIELELTDGTLTQWEIFAAGDYPIAQDYLIAEPSDAYFLWEVDEMQHRSYNAYTGMDIAAQDKVLILSTCTLNEDMRYIVCARLIAAA